MRIGCLFFPIFAVQVELKDNNALKGKPVIIGGFPYELKPVCDASEEAMKHGVKPGMSLRQAYVLCPQGIFLPLAEGKYNEACTGIVSLLANYSPAIELGAKNCMFLDSTLESNEMGFMKGIMEIIREETSFNACSSIASNKFVAWVASQITTPGEPLVIRDGEERGLLKDLPVDLLPASPESLRMLKLFGIYKMGELAQLPCEAMKSQFGKEGQILWQLANGIDNSRLVPCKMPETLKGEFSFEPLAENLALILNRANELLSKLSWELKQRWQCCRQLTVSLSLADGHITQRTFHFKEPTSSKEAMLGQLKHCLEEARFAAPVREMRLSLSDLCSEEGKQASLLDKPLKSRQRLMSAISQLQHRYGKEVVKKVVSRDKAALPEDSFSFTKFNF
jgi:nucleotidyltransferase/DNA polymerase involved in DNA repair